MKEILLSKNEVVSMSMEDVIVKFKPLTIKLSKPYFYKYESDDLIQVSNMALIKAYNKYDITKGVLFTTYAYKFILQELLNYNRNNSKLKDYTICSLDFDINNNKDDTKTSIQETLKDEKVDIEKSIVALEVFKYSKKYIESLKERDRNIISLFINGYTNKYIRESQKCTTDIVKNVIKKFRNNIKMEFSY